MTAPTVGAAAAPDQTASIVASDPIGSPTEQFARKPPSDDPACQWSPSHLDALTIGLAIARAVCANPRVTEAMLVVRADVAQYGGAISQFLPTVVATSQRARSYSRSSGTFGPTEDKSVGSSHSIVVNWLMWDFGGRAAQIRAAERAALASMASEDVVVQATIEAVTESYLSIQAFIDLQNASVTAVAATSAALRAAEARNASGAGTSVDVEFARLNREQARLASTRAEEQVALAKGELASLMNLSADTPITLLRAVAGDVPGDFDATLSTNVATLMKELERHSEIRAAEERAAAAEAQISVARSEFFPKVNAVGNYYFGGRPGASVADRDTRERFFGLTISIPLTSVLTERNRLKSLRAQHKRSLAQSDDTKRRVQTTFWKAFLVAKTSGRIVATARLADRHAASAAKQAQVRYSNGATDISEWLRALKARADTQAELIRATSDMRMARARLLLSLGRLGPWRLGRAPASDIERRPTPERAALSRATR